MIRSQLFVPVFFGLLAVPILAQKTGCDMVTQKEASSNLPERRSANGAQLAKLHCARRLAVSG
jgi:hypothetical protein